MKLRQMYESGGGVSLGHRFLAALLALVLAIGLAPTLPLQAIYANEIASPEASATADAFEAGGVSETAQASGEALLASENTVDAPVAATGLVYNGVEQTGVAADTGYTLSGTTSATNAGDYTATATLADGYVWADGTSNAKVIEWSIAKATLTAKVNSNRKWIMYNKDADGNYALCTLSLSDVTVTGFVNSENAAKASGYVAPTNTVPDEKPVWGNMVEVTPAGGAADNYEFTYESTSLKTGIVSDATGTEGSGKKAPSSSGDGMSAGVYRGTVNLYVPGKYNTVLTNVNAFPSSPNDPMASNTYAISVGCMTAGADGAAPTLPAVENAEFTINDDGTVSMTLEIPNEVFTIQSIESGENITVESYTTKEATYKPMFGTPSKPSRIETITVTLKDLSGSYELTNCKEFPTLLGQDWSVPLIIAVDFQTALMKIDAPVAATGLVYNGAEQTGVAAGTGYTLSGTTSATNAGDYTATATLESGYTWADGTSGEKTILWSIAKKRITVPTAVTGLTYNGSEQTGVAAGEGYTLSGDYRATNAGDYSATATLSDTTNTEWADSTTDDKTISWSIAKAAGSVKLNPTLLSLSLDEEGLFDVRIDGDGELSISNSNEQVATYIIEETGQLTIHPLAAGSTVITYSMAEGTNYTAAQASAAVTVTAASPTPEPTPTPTPTPTVESQAMYRLYNPNSGEHFYTANEDERSSLIVAGWDDEGIGWYAPVTSNTPVFRMYNSNPSPVTGSGEHHYTTSETERDSLVAAGWEYEGIGWYSDDAQGTPLYRVYNPNEFNNNHHYTTSEAERDHLLSLGWNDEGIAWYGVAK